MISESIIIQKVISSESEILAKLSATTFYETFVEFNTKEDMDQYIDEKCSSEKMKEEINDPSNQFFFAKYNSEIVGYIKLRTSIVPIELTTTNCLEIERIYVSSEFHGKKIGAQLMQFCINFAQENKYSILWLAVWEHNLKAYEFYKNWGFIQFSKQIFILGKDKQNDFLMKKNL